MIENRSKAIKQTSMISITVNLILAVIKMIIGTATGYISFVLDGINNISDSFNQIMIIIGIRLSEKKPDEKHPYGYGRVEHLTSLAVAILTIFVGASAFDDALGHLRADRHEMPIMADILIMLLTIVVKLSLGCFLRYRGEKLKCSSLIATGYDSLSDCLITVGAIAGAEVSGRFHINIDGYVGIIIACLIIKVGLGLLWEACQNLIGNKIDTQLTHDICKYLYSLDMVDYVGNVILNDYEHGSIFGSCEIFVDCKYSFDEVSHLISSASKNIYQKYAVAMAISPMSTRPLTDYESRIYDFLIRYTINEDAIYRTAGYYYDGTEDMLYFTLELKASKSTPEVRNMILEKIHREFPDGGYDINWRRNISD